MKELIGDFWDNTDGCDALVCTTNCVVKANGELVMGAGIAKQFASKYPFLPKDWGERTEQIVRYFKSSVLVSMKDGMFYIAFPTKYHWKDKSPLELIERSAFQLRVIAQAHGWQKVLIPRPGCANGGLTWEEVKPVLKKWFDDRFYVIERHQR